KKYTRKQTKTPRGRIGEIKYKKRQKDKNGRRKKVDRKGFLGIVSRGYGDVGKFILPKEVKEVLLKAKANRDKEFNEWLNRPWQKAKQTSEATEVKAPEKQERVVKKVPFVRNTTREQMQETLDELEEQDNPNRRPQEKRRSSLLSQIFERRERRELERQIDAERDRLRQEEFRNTLRNDITTPTSLNQTAVGNKTKEKPKSKEREK
ncbi:MAG: hypothetical protein IKT27_00660, partial [Clostridia bacterium]|nr:hypothetical protein [Clostridia bacterium]